MAYCKACGNDCWRVGRDEHRECLEYMQITFGEYLRRLDNEEMAEYISKLSGASIFAIVQLLNSKLK